MIVCPFFLVSATGVNSADADLQFFPQVFPSPEFSWKHAGIIV